MLILLEKTRLDSKGVILLTFLFLVFVFVFTDSLYSAFHDRTFNPTESVVRSTFWCLFFPILYALDNRKAQPAYLKVVVAAFFHLVVLLLILIGISVFSGSEVSLYEFVYHRTAQYSIIPLITYGLYVGLVTRFERSTLSSHASFNMQARTDRLTIKNGSKSVVIALKDIQYITTAKPYIKVVTGTGSWLYSSSLSAFLSEYGKDYLVRVHKSVIVNPDMITAISSRKNGDFDLTLLNGDVVRASRNYRDQFRQLI